MDTRITSAAFKACWRVMEKGKGKGKAASGDTHYFFQTRVEEREKGERVTSVYLAASDA